MVKDYQTKEIIEEEPWSNAGQWDWKGQGFDERAINNKVASTQEKCANVRETNKGTLSTMYQSY